MKIRIKETKEIKELIIRGNNNVDWTRDLIGDDYNLTYNYDDDVYELSKEAFMWWEEYITNKIADDEEISELAEKYGDIVYERLEKICCDLEDEHSYMRTFIEEMKEEFA